MTYSIYREWDPLRVCVVGRSYPPEFYSWITVPHVRKLFERIATETEEDFQCLIKKLEEFDVKVLRPDLLEHPLHNDKFLPPPMNPRDFMVMIGTTFYESYSFNIQQFINQVRDESWPECHTLDDFYKLPQYIQDECFEQHNLGQLLSLQNSWDNIIGHVKLQGNQIKSRWNQDLVNGAMLYQMDKNLYFGTLVADQNITQLQTMLDQEFSATKNYILPSQGHMDATFCPVTPGLLISRKDIDDYSLWFPDWEVVYLPYRDWGLVKEWRHLKSQNRGRWWIPGFEHDQEVINVVEKWLSHWTGHIEETTFDVNMLILDQKNVIVTGYNELVFNAFKQHGITPHVVPLRHKHFWDGGLHCVTADLHRESSAL
jgi:N-dimethylarginine dimethylaminohydrolase